MTYKKRIELFQVILLLLLLIVTHWVVYKFGVNKGYLTGQKAGQDKVFIEIQRTLKERGIALSIKK